MGLFDGLRRGRRRTASSSEEPAPAPGVRRAQVTRHLQAFCAEQRGVEAFVEPATKDTSTTLMLIAGTGEWTRRQVPTSDVAWELARSLGIPVYDVQQTGYPQRMRDWNSAVHARQRARDKAEAAEREARRRAR